MNDARTTELHPSDFAEFAPVGGPPGARLSIEDLRNIRLSLTASLGDAFMTVREVLDLKPGSVVQLDKLAGEMTDIQVNGVPLARGEVVVIADTLHVRVGEVFGVSPEEREADDDL